MAVGRVRHHAETVAFISHFQQKIALTDFRHRLFHHHRLRGLCRHFQQRMLAGVIFALWQISRIFLAARIQRAVGIRQRAHNAAEHHFLAEKFMRIGVDNIFIGAIHQIAPRLFDTISINTIAAAIKHAAVGAFNQPGRILRLQLGNHLRMLHKHAVEIHIHRLNAVAGRHFAHARRELHHGNAVLISGRTFKTQARLAVYIAQSQNLSRINQMRVADFVAVCAPKTAPLPRAVKIAA